MPTLVTRHTQITFRPILCILKQIPWCPMVQLCSVRATHLALNNNILFFVMFLRSRFYPNKFACCSFQFVRYFFFDIHRINKITVRAVPRINSCARRNNRYTDSNVLRITMLCKTTHIRTNKQNNPKGLCSVLFASSVFVEQNKKPICSVLFACSV
jgi:hypothetical protein